MTSSVVSPGQFSSFGDLLKYLRRREELTQRELAVRVGYSDTQISRIEQNQRIPDSATLKALFLRALHLEHQPEWAVRLLDLAEQARRDGPVESGQEEKKPSPGNLPAPLTSFIGREKEQAEILRLVANHRLVTLTGAGGIGKTRLALVVGEKLSKDYAHGAWLVELAPVSDPGVLPQTVVSALRLAPHPALTYTELIVNFLRQRSVLLILDNCEHLLDGAARLTALLLRECPQLRILATSREALGILGEMQYRLPSLAVPAAQEAPAELGGYESIRLFEARARLALPDFSVTAENAASVAQICSHLDGIPLAIELAAARVNIFSTEQIASRLEGGLGLLAAGNRTALPRHQTIYASIDWSWNLISEAEQALLRRLTVFSGGWTLEAAEAVCSFGTVQSSQVLELMTQLASKSLVNSGHQAGMSRRFYLHEMINQFARAKLIEAGEENDARLRHLAYFSEFSGLSAWALHGPQQNSRFAWLKAELENLRVALEYALHTDLEAGLNLSSSLMEFWRYFDLQEGLRWTTQLVQGQGSGSFPNARARAMLARANLLWNMQQFDEAHSLVEECLAYFRACRDKEGEFDSMMLMGALLQFLEGMQPKTELQVQALELARSMGDDWRQAVALVSLGWDQRDPARGRAYWQEGISLLRQLGDWRMLAQTLGILGLTILSRDEIDVAERLLDEAHEINQQIEGHEMEFVWTGKSQIALLRGDYTQARAYLQQNLEMQEALGNRMGYLWGRLRLAYVALREGSLPESRVILSEVIGNFRADHNQSGLASALDKVASLCVLDKKHETAARLIGWSDAARERIGDPRPRIEQEDLDRDIEAMVEILGQSAYRAAYDLGRQMTLDQAVSCALENCSG